MADNFDRSVAFVLRREGGYVNDPRDPGGETKYGISKRAYPDLDIKNLTEEQAKEIYRRDYWQKAGCDGLDWPLCLAVLDAAVNCGAARAKEFAASANGLADYLFLRLRHYANLKKPEFLRGWTLRVIDLWDECKGKEAQANTGGGKK